MMKTTKIPPRQILLFSLLQILLFRRQTLASLSIYLPCREITIQTTIQTFPTPFLSHNIYIRCVRGNETNFCQVSRVFEFFSSVGVGPKKCKKNPFRGLNPNFLCLSPLSLTHDRWIKFFLHFRHTRIEYHHSSSFFFCSVIRRKTIRQREGQR